MPWELARDRVFAVILDDEVCNHMINIKRNHIPSGLRSVTPHNQRKVSARPDLRATLLAPACWTIIFQRLEPLFSAMLVNHDRLNNLTPNVILS